MKNENRIVALKYDAQARYFIEAAMLASEHAKENREKNLVAYNNFEGVIVGTNHAFAAELLLKGIIYFHEGTHPKHHGIKDLLNHKSCKYLKDSLKKTFEQNKHTSFTKDNLDILLDEYLLNLDKNDKSEKKEIENINRIRREFEFGSFEYLLELHSNHFVKMRYACEKFPPPLDMNFTSFLIQQLRNELENNLLKVET